MFIRGYLESTIMPLKSVSKFNEQWLITLVSLKTPRCTLVCIQDLEISIKGSL